MRFRPKIKNNKMKLQVGKNYISRKGEVFRIDNYLSGSQWPYRGGGHSWRKDGSFGVSVNDVAELDLVFEFVSQEEMTRFEKIEARIDALEKLVKVPPVAPVEYDADTTPENRCSAGQHQRGEFARVIGNSTRHEFNVGEIVQKIEGKGHFENIMKNDWWLNPEDFQWI